MEIAQQLQSELELLQENMRQITKRVQKLEYDLLKFNRLASMNTKTLMCNTDKLLILDLFQNHKSEWVVRFRRRPATKERIEFKSKHIAIWKNLTLPRQYMKKIANSVHTNADSHTKQIVLTRVRGVAEAVRVFVQINDLLHSFDRNGQSRYYSNMKTYLKSSPLDDATYYPNLVESPAFLTSNPGESDSDFELETKKPLLPPPRPILTPSELVNNDSNICEIETILQIPQVVDTTTIKTEPDVLSVSSNMKMEENITFSTKDDQSYVQEQHPEVDIPATEVKNTYSTGDCVHNEQKSSVEENPLLLDNNKRKPKKRRAPKRNATTYSKSSKHAGGPTSNVEPIMLDITHMNNSQMSLPPKEDL